MLIYLGVANIWQSYISIYKRMILFSNILNLLIRKYLYSKIRKCLQDMEILKISYNEMKKNEWK